MRLFLLLALIIAIAIIFFTVQNPHDLTLKLFNWEFTKPLPLMLAFPFIIGAIAGMSLIMPLWMKKSKVAKTQKKRIHELEEEIANSAAEVEEEPAAELQQEGEAVENEDVPEATEEEHRQ